MSPGRDLGVLDGRGGRSVRLHGGGRARGDHVIAPRSRHPRAGAAAAPPRAASYGATPGPMVPRSPSRSDHTCSTVRGARRAIEPPIDDDPVVHAVACPRYRACDPHGVLPVVRRQGVRKNPRGARERTYDHRVSGEEQIRSDQHRGRGATAQVPPHGSASAAVHPSAGETLPGSGASTATTVSAGMLEDATDAANRAPLSIIAAASAVTTNLTSRCLKDRAGRVGRTTSWWWIEARGAWRPFVLGLTGLPRRGGCDGCRPR
jgi:hypothetical protein